MSALGHKQTFAAAEAMSALPPKADMCCAIADVRRVPIADIVPSCLRQMHFDVIVTLLARQRDLACQRGGDLQVGCAIGDRGSVDTPSDEIVRRF